MDSCSQLDARRSSSPRMHTRIRTFVSGIFALTLLSAKSITAQSNTTHLAPGLCSPTIPCSTGACCNGQTGLCGFGATFCGVSCTSNCGALAECGHNSAMGSCPLSACCNIAGFCGTGPDFCGTTCGNQCTDTTPPSCAATAGTALPRRIGYYQGSAASRNCMAYPPEQIAANTLTHINYASAVIDSSFHIAQMSPGDTDLWLRTTALKIGRPDLKVFLSIGGWTFNNPGTTSGIFSGLVGSAANTNTFIASALSVLESYGFDGIDVDWEYPGAADRGGVPADTANYVSFLSLIKSAFRPHGYGLSFTAPSLYWYLQKFNLPAMLASADWVNVLSFDLHGSWDGVNPYVDYTVHAHSNLTEIDVTLQLFWRAGVDPSQVVLGMALYGRSFTLVDRSCPDPGCPWLSGGNAGLCSGTSGTLMSSEIQSLLTDDIIDPTIDLVAAVGYLTSEDDQWVSFETADTFALKMNYANTHCLGGTFIWSVDQDDSAYNALSGIFPTINGSSSSSSTQTACYITQCGATACNPGYVASTTSYSPLKGICGVGAPALVCCPEPKNVGECTKRGWSNAATPCKPQCNSDEFPVAQDIYGNSPTDVCVGGTTAICCKTDVPLPDGCALSACSSTPSAACPAGSSFVTALTPAGASCSAGTAQALCCQNTFPYTDCIWSGTPPLCDDATCIGQVSVLSDPSGDGSQSCSGLGKRVYCCDLPVPLAPQFSDIFPAGTAQGSESLYVEFDQDLGNSSSSKSSSHSSFTTSTDENSTAFGELFIDSPKQGSVSSMALRSNWVITNCSATSDQPQQVLAYCSVPNNPMCSHVHIDGAANTVIELPKSCGAGPYARIISLTVHPDQNALDDPHAAMKPATESLFQLNFDYDFLAIPASNGPIYMRADISDMPGYWDSIVDSPPERKRWLQERELEKPIVKRWWGGFTTWVAKINVIKQDISSSRNFFWQDTLQLFKDSIHCDGPPETDASVDVSLTGSANLNARYGFYLQGTIVPAAVTAAYLHFSSDASVSATATIKGQAGITYDSTHVTFGTFGFPGLHWPGIITIGPSLQLQGYIEGQLSISGTLTAGVSYQLPSVFYSLGNTRSDVVGPAANPPPPTNGFTSDLGYEVDLSGDISVHVVPSIRLGIFVLGGNLINAQAYISADISAGVALNGSVSDTVAAQICVAPHYGALLVGGVTGSLLYWELADTEWQFYANSYTFGDKCWTSITEPAKRSESLISASNGVLPLHPPVNYTSRLLETSAGKIHVVQPVTSSQTVVGRNLDKCPGFLDCPATKQQIGAQNWDDDLYSDVQPILDDDALYRRGTYNESSEFWERDNLPPHLQPISDVAIMRCKGVTFSPYGYINAGLGFFHLQNSNNLDGVTPSPAAVGKAPGMKYGREHVYEMQLIAGFIDFLFSNSLVWQPNPAAVTTPKFCAWVKKYITTPGYVPGTTLSMVDLLKKCVPSDNHSLIDDKMPWLESTMNGIKALAFGGKMIRTPATFNNYAFTKKIFVARATVGVAEYLQDTHVQAQFVQGSDCIKDYWQLWQNKYQADTGNTVDVVALYRNWIINAVDSVQPNLLRGLDTMIGLFAISAGGTMASTVNVVVSVPLNVAGVAARPISGNLLVATLRDELDNLSLLPISALL